MPINAWNYSFSVPCVLLTLTLVAFYFSKPRLPIRLNRTFFFLIVAQLLVIATDLGSALADEHYQLFSTGMLYVLNTLYFMFYMARMFLFYVITLDILHRFSKKFLLVSSIPFIISEIICLSCVFTGAIFSIDGGMYAKGPGYFVVYLFPLFYIALSTVLIIMRKSKLDQTEFASLLFYNGVLLVGLFVRYTFPSLLAMNTFCLMAIFIIYLSFINPDFYLVPRMLAFNDLGFRETLEDHAEHSDCSVLGFAIRNYNYECSVLGASQMSNAVALMMAYLSESFDKIVPFYLSEGRFALIGEEKTDWEEVRNAIRRRYRNPWKVRNIALSFAPVYAGCMKKVTPESVDKVINSLYISLDETSESLRYSMDEPVSQEIDMRSIDDQINALRALEDALEHDSVEVFLQPLVDAKTHQVVAAEALARIYDEDGTVIPPDTFIPIAERNGSIDQLDEQVLQKTCAFIKTHDLAEIGLQWINVNVSPVQCMQQGMAERLSDIIEQNGVEPQNIHFELTEQFIIDFDQLMRQVKMLKEYGFNLSLDDYGSGYSNLVRVKRYLFTNIKLDIEVVRDYDRQPNELLPAIVDGFHRVGMTVTAEGIETPKMADELSAIGCDYHQGFLFSEPLPIDEFVKRYSRAGAIER